MRASFIFVLLVAVQVSLFVIFFYKQASTMPWTPATYLIHGENSNSILMEEFVSLPEDQGQRQQQAGEVLHTEKTQKTYKNMQLLESGFKLKDLLSRENTDSKTQSGGRGEREERSQLQQTFAARKNLIILSPGRGGSTFLGSLFDCSPHVIYCYEPLYAVAQKMFKVNLVRGDKEPKNYKETSIKLIDSFLDCDFSDVSKATFSAFSRSDLHRGKSKALSKKYLPRISKTSLSKACNAYNYTVIKILSSRVPSKTIQTFKELFQKRNRYDVKMVHLVRDPRAVVFSRIKSVKWMKDHLSHGFHKNVERICDPILRNVRLGLLYPPPWLKNRFKVIRYEDLTLNTLNTTRELYSFAGFNWSASVDEWIRALTKNTKQRGAYTVFRNASAAVDSWKNAPEPLVRAVENICGALMDFLGYEKLRKQDIDNTVNVAV